MVVDSRFLVNTNANTNDYSRLPKQALLQTESESPAKHFQLDGKYCCAGGIFWLLVRVRKGSEHGGE
jgi:hypothetical protein